MARRKRIDANEFMPILGKRTRKLTEAGLAQARANVEAIAAQRRAATHCKRGHEFTEENTYRKSDGRRQCKTCASDYRYYKWRGMSMPD